MGIPFFAQRFVAGLSLPEVVTAVLPLYEAGIATSLDILGENVKTKDEALKATEEYIELVSTIHQQKLNSHISIKLTMLGLDISQELCDELLTNLLTAAEKAGVFVRIDMEGSAYTQKTIDTYLKMLSKFQNVGVVLQAYLYRTKDDLNKIIKAQGHVRLCKGAYKESNAIAIQEMSKIRENYIALASELLTHSSYPAFATHDDFLILKVKDMAQIKHRSPDSFEFQMLYGLRKPSWFQFINDHYRFRVYVPYGKTWFPYFSRRLRERKENVFFVVRNLFRA